MSNWAIVIFVSVVSLVAASCAVNLKNAVDILLDIKHELERIRKGEK